MSPSWRIQLVGILAVLSVVPSVGSAVPIDEPPMRERLVEGHTVFMTIDAYQWVPQGGSFYPSDAGSVRSLVAESLDQRRIERFPGVAWFNDQYLVGPETKETSGLGGGTWIRSEYAAAMSVLVRADDGYRVREPCGGALMAVNAGDPDPRQALARIHAATPGLRGPTGGWMGEVYPMRLETLTDGDDTVGGYDEPTFVTIDSGVTVDVNEQTVEGDVVTFSDAPLATYLWSYRFTDPTDRIYVVDLFEFYVDGRYFPVWVTNLYGLETFIPDRATVRFGPAATDDCASLQIIGESTYALDGALCGLAIADVSLPQLPLYAEDPCMSYQEPASNGYCYGGQGPSETTWCDHGERPLRRHQAVLYFEWAHLAMPAEPVDHCAYDPTLDSNWESPGAEGGCNPALMQATNGCQSGTQWPCPGEAPWYGVYGADDLEGNSHSSHPVAPPHEEQEMCPVAAPNPTNHGGSTAGDGGLCDYYHATAEVDVYYSGRTRPLVPGDRFYVVDDLRGSMDAFSPIHDAYPGVP